LKILSTVVNDLGFIDHFESASSDASAVYLKDAKVHQIPTGSFVLPTFSDLHLHAPQFLYQGNGLDLPLMQWLDQYTFKAEERIDADHNLARKVYETLAKRLVTNGTGTVVLFGTLKEETK
jgi:guanine deaminase